MLTITNPYHGSKQSYPNTLAYLLRVPRRLRPVFLIGFCFISFALVLVNNSMSRSSQMDSILKQQRQMHSRRFIPIDGLLGINDRRNQALMGSGAKAREAESAVQSAWSPPSNVETLAFASTQDEFAALISVRGPLLTRSDC